MKCFSRGSVVLTLLWGMAASDPAGGNARPEPISLRFDPSFTLQAVAREMNVTLRSEIPVPKILLQSTTPLRRFQDAIGPQWGFRPHVFSNAYATARNEIYLTDDASYYARLGRSLDDSLAHELAHYIQVRYLNADLADASWESDAVAVQGRFAEIHLAR